MLTGEFATEVSDASGMQLLDIPGRCWSDEVLTKLGIDKSLLAKVYESPEITGTVTKAVAQATGLKEGTPVVGGAGDNAAAAVGTGVVEDGKAFTTIGSSGVEFARAEYIHSAVLCRDAGTLWALLSPQVCRSSGSGTTLRGARWKQPLLWALTRTTLWIRKPAVCR